MRFALILAAAVALSGCGPCKTCKDKDDACRTTCEADHSGCVSDCATTTNVAGCEDTCDAELDACDADCDVDLNQCVDTEC